MVEISLKLPFDDVSLEVANSIFVASGIAGGWKGFALTASRFAAKISQQFEMVAHPRNLQQLNRDLKRMSVSVVARPRFEPTAVSKTARRSECSES